MNRYHFVIDSTLKDKKIKKLFLKKFKNYPIKLAKIIVVVGGDGFMLETLKKYQKYKKTFYGINNGTFGFLMNKFKSFDLDNIISQTKLILISPLEMNVTTKRYKKVHAIAINEVSILRQSKQTSSLKIIKNKKILIKKLIGDGVLVSSPAGSTAYNLSVNGPILSLNCKKIAVTPISPFRPRRWKGKILSDKSSIEIMNLNIKKRPISIVADNVEVRNIRKATIKINNSIKFKLLYDRNNSLIKKIKLEQLRKQII